MAATCRRSSAAPPCCRDRPDSAPRAGTDRQSPEGREPRLLVEIHPRFMPGEFVPYYLWILPVVVGLGYILSAHLARPAAGCAPRGGAVRAAASWRRESARLAATRSASSPRFQLHGGTDRDVAHRGAPTFAGRLARATLAAGSASLWPCASPAPATIARGRSTASNVRLTAWPTLSKSCSSSTTAEGDPQARHDKEVAVDLLLDEARLRDCTLEAEAKDCRLDFRCGRPAAGAR